jgi:hypothetical protein
MSEKICGNCKYCFPIKWLRDGKWYYSACCTVFPITEPNDKDSFALIVDTESDRCEMYTAQGSLKPKEEDTGVFKE